jgi:hypothetical protein
MRLIDRIIASIVSCMKVSPIKSTQYPTLRDIKRSERNSFTKFASHQSKGYIPRTTGPCNTSPRLPDMLAREPKEPPHDTVPPRHHVDHTAT